MFKATVHSGCFTKDVYSTLGLFVEGWTTTSSDTGVIYYQKNG